MAPPIPQLHEMLSALSARQDTLHTAYHYSGPNPLPHSLTVTIPQELRPLAGSVAWGQALTNALEERIELKDVRLPGDDEFTKKLRRWIEDSDLREAMSEAHEESLRTGIGYIVTSSHPDLDDTPLFTAESPTSFYADVDPRTGKVRWAIRAYANNPTADAVNVEAFDRVTVYLPDSTRYYRQGNMGWESDPEIEDVEHGLGEPPVEALINRRSRRNPFGVPEHRAIWSLQDAACRSLTSMQIAQEFSAIPQKVILNADEDDFAGGEDEGPVTQAELVLRRFLVLTGDSKIGEYSAAQLQNYTGALSSLARQASAVSGLPLDFLGVSSDANPSSGDAIRGSNDRLIRRAQRFARGLTPAWVRIIAKGARMLGEGRDDLARIQITWADPGTVTPGALADAAQKLSSIRTAEGPLFTREYLWKFLDVSPEDREAMQDSASLNTFSSLLNGGDVDGGTDTAGSVSGATDTN